MNPPNTFTSNRVLNAPPEAVFKALSNPEIISKWWGPFGFTNTNEEFDFTPGGKWLHDMIGPDGTVYPNHSVFEEISPERIVIRHLATVHEFVLEILIDAVGDRSRITWNQTFMSAEEFQKCEAYIPRCNAEVLDRLELELSHQITIMNTNRNPVGWFEIYVQDMERAKIFYESVFRVTLDKLPSPGPNLEMWVFPGMGCENQFGCSGALRKMKDMDSGAGGTIVYFSCEDCGETETRVIDAGGKIHLPKMSIGEYGYFALVVDPEGNMIGVHSMT